MVMTTIVSASASACSSPSSLISVRYGGEFRGHQSSQWMRRRTAVVFCNLLAFRGNSAACLSRRRFTSTQGRRSGSITRTRVSSITSSNSEGVSESQLFRVGPLPGDLAEVEGFCRIFRAAEQLHSAIMKTLCDPVTGECAVTYDESDDNILGDVPVLEEKVVAALACMGSLLQRGKEEVLFGRPVQKGFNNVAEWNDGKLPPLASFREEMKHCCLKLQNAIESYFLPSDERTHDIWMKLQRLKNVSYDAGFPRPEGSPFHAVLPNWYAVRLFPIKSRSEANDSEVAFWRGGQVTEEGFKWLLERGYKTIVDLRAERNEDYWADAAVEEAVNLGKIQLIHIPVKIGNAPSKKQVDEFADLLQNRDRMPLYLHSQEGVLRASAMVSRWREVALRSRSTLSSSSMPNANQMLSFNFQNHDMGSNGKYPTTDLLKAQETDRDGNYKNGNGQNGSLMKSYQTHEAKQQFEPSLHGKGANIMDSIKDCVNGGKKLESNDKDNQNSSLTESWWHISPFEAQRPSCNIFSRKEMSQMLKDRKITPKLYSKGSSKMRHTYSKNTQSLVIGTSKLSCLQAIDSTMPSHVSSSSNSLGKTFVKGHSKNSNRLPYSNTDTQSQTTDVSGKVMLMDVNKINKHLADNNKVVSEIDPKSVSHVQPFVDSTSNGNGDIAHVDGNMCASTTGVVRLQSRKKAEMYLVRTDGFSCSRERVKESSLAFTHPSTQQQMLMWKTPPKTVLLLKKLGQELMEEAKQVASFLHFKEKMNVVVEPELHDLFSRVTGYGFIQTFYNQDLSNLHERVDLVACLGGDGLILHASNLFRQAVPPVVSFNLGSLGFLTAHPFADYQRDLSAIIHGNNMVEGVYITLRMRLRCQIFRKGKVVPGKLFEILNEVAVDRGSSPYLCKIECYERNCLITKVQADGVIVATPTGSTAYSTSAGGSMVHPNVPCMLFTPICPHSLSFRPVILPDSAQLILKIPDDARSNAWVSFDGKRRQQLLKGDSVHICMSEHPLPTVNKSDQTGDWFKSLVRCLNWNDRLEQKSFL